MCLIFFSSPEKCNCYTDTGSISSSTAVSKYRRTLPRRQGSTTYTCEDKETCMDYRNAGYHVCINLETGQFTDQDGGRGDTIEETYTDAATGATGTATMTRPAATKSGDAGATSVAGGTPWAGNAAEGSRVMAGAAFAAVAGLILPVLL